MVFGQRIGAWVEIKTEFRIELGVQGGRGQPIPAAAVDPFRPVEPSQRGFSARIAVAVSTLGSDGGILDAFGDDLGAALVQMHELISAGLIADGNAPCEINESGSPQSILDTGDVQPFGLSEPCAQSLLRCPADNLLIGAGLADHPCERRNGGFSGIRKYGGT